MFQHTIWVHALVSHQSMQDKATGTGSEYIHCHVRLVEKPWLKYCSLIYYERKILFVA
jgi:hypothetical protein